MNVHLSVATVERRIAAIDAAATAGDRLEFASAVRAQAAPPRPVTAHDTPAQFDALIRANAVRYGVDPSLVRAVVVCESGGDAFATSPAGAAGLMQLMPATALRLGVRDAYDPAQNVDGGTRLLRSLLDRFGGDVPRAVAAYNAGAGAVERYDGVPPYAQTQRYVARVLAVYAQQRG